MLLYFRYSNVTAKQTNQTTFSIENLPVQSSPLPVYPDLQVHLNEPGTSTHEAVEEQLCFPSKHSLISKTVLITMQVKFSVLMIYHTNESQIAGEKKKRCMYACMYVCFVFAKYPSYPNDSCYHGNHEDKYIGILGLQILLDKLSCVDKGCSDRDSEIKVNLHCQCSHQNYSVQNSSFFFRTLNMVLYIKPSFASNSFDKTCKWLLSLNSHRNDPSFIWP